MSILVDFQIRAMATATPLTGEAPLLDPFDERCLSSMGYDLRLGHDFLIPVLDTEEQVVDPFNPPPFAKRTVKDSIIIPSGGFVLGSSIEYIRMPHYLVGVCLGRSTYCRAGVLTHVSPLEPGWHGNATIEISNTNPLPVRVWCERGITQVQFTASEVAPERDYSQKGGRYQGQVGVQQGRPER